MKKSKVMRIMLAVFVAMVTAITVAMPVKTVASASTPGTLEEGSVTIAESGGFFPGITLTGETNKYYKIANVDLTQEKFKDAKTPIVQMMPYTQQRIQNTDFNLNATWYRACVDFVSTVNPAKKISVMMYSRTNDTYELNLACELDGKTGYKAESWYNDTKDPVSGDYNRSKKDLLGGWSRGTALVTQKFDLSGYAYRDFARDEDGNHVNHVAPIDIYYDRNTHELTTGMGFCAEYRVGQPTSIRGEQTRVWRNGKWRYTIRDLDFDYEGCEYVWEPWTDEEASSVDVMFRFAEIIDMARPPQITFLTIGGNAMVDDMGDGQTFAEKCIAGFSSRKYAHKVTYKNGSTIVATKEVPVGEALESDNAPTDKLPQREGYTFAGWYKDGNKYLFLEDLTDDITLEAKYSFACENCTGEVIEGTTVCPTCGFDFDLGAVPTNPDEKKDKKGCGKESVSLIALVLSALAITLVVKNK